jgi:transcriptional regulator of acetoin/glycerol metabolism
VQGIAAEALSLFMAYDWPGNIRELENAIERAFILCGDGRIDIAHLPGELTAHGSMSGPDAKIRSAHDILDAQAIRAALARNTGNRLAAARELGIHKTTLYRRMKKLGIPFPLQNGRTRRKEQE